jgi:phage terminase small subunit
MGHLKSLPNVDDGLAAAIPNFGGNVASEIPDPPAKLSVKEKAIWLHITTALHEVGLIHLTDGLMLKVICTTFVRWVEAEESLSKFQKGNGGHYIIRTPNGYEQPHQLYYMSRNLKRELLQWLPEAAMTIPSFHKIMGERAIPDQGNLFDDPIATHKKLKAKIGLVAHTGGK